MCQAAKKTKKMHGTQMCYLLAGTIRLPNIAFRISKTTKLISIKFIYFLPYIYTV